MTVTKITLVFSACVLLLACNKPTNQASQKEDTTKIVEKKEEPKAKEIEAIYINCTVYAASTQFFFKSVAKGDTINVSVLAPEMRDPKDNLTYAKMPEKMIDDDPKLEGVPGAHPKMVGKKFKIIYNDKDEVVEVKLAQ